MKSALLSFVLICSATVNAQVLNNVWELTELNNPSETDAYPYLTDDGLRLYFTNNESGSNNIYFTSRPDVNTDFATKQLLDGVLFDGINSCWFTTDELDIYYSSSSEIFHATRLTTASPFGTPVQISLVGGTETFIGGPSLTPGGEELYFYNGIGLSKFEYTNDTTYTYVSDVVAPVGNEGFTGQLSKDGLELYWSTSPIGTDSTFLTKLDRAAIGDAFTNPVLMNNFINSSVLNNSQASYATAANVLVWVRNDDNSWDGNELFIAQNATVTLHELNNVPKQLIRVVDLMGREVTPEKNRVLIYVYSDGTTERVFNFE